MASRVRGSGAQSLILYSAADWKSAVHVVKRDCVSTQGIMNDPKRALREVRSVSFYSYSPFCVFPFIDINLHELLCISEQGVYYQTDQKTPADMANVVITTVANDVLRGSLTFGDGKQWDDIAGCIQSDTAQSIIGINLHPMYNNTKSAVRSILMQEQPFAMTGDTTLTGVRDGSGNYFVQVDRLYGNEVNDFTMVNVLKEFPAHPPVKTQEMGGKAQVRVDKLPIPYAYSDGVGTRHPATSSRSSVFFAVNPSLAMFQAFAAFCLTDGLSPFFQISVLSSYAPIRVWKIDPYIYCPDGADGRTECEPGEHVIVNV